MLVVTFKKILFIVAGILTVFAGFVSLLFPIIPGFVLIFVGIIFLARAWGGHREIELKNKIKTGLKKLKPGGLKTMLQKVVTILF